MLNVGGLISLCETIDTVKSSNCSWEINNKAIKELQRGELIPIFDPIY
jgi:hypothetical protein